MNKYVKAGFDETLTLISFILAVIVSIVKNLGSLIKVVRDKKSQYKKRKKDKKKSVKRSK